MAAKLGLEIYEWVNKFARKLAAKPDKTGIMQIPNQETVRNLSNDILTKFMKHNVPREALNSENDIKVIYNQIKNIENQALQHRVISPGDPRHKEITERIFGKKSADVLDLSGKKIPPHTQIMGGEEVIVDVVSDTVTNMKKMTPMDAMKEANLVIGRKGKYKNLTIDESQDILKKTNDHIFERDIKYDEFGEIIKPDPEDLAGGGTAGRTSTGLNYLLGEDDQNVRVPFEKAGKVDLGAILKGILPEREPPQLREGLTGSADPSMGRTMPAGGLQEVLDIQASIKADKGEQNKYLGVLSYILDNADQELAENLIAEIGSAQIKTLTTMSGYKQDLFEKTGVIPIDGETIYNLVINDNILGKYNLDVNAIADAVGTKEIAASLKNNDMGLSWNSESGQMEGSWTFNKQEGPANQETKWSFTPKISKNDIQDSQEISLSFDKAIGEGNIQFSASDKASAGGDNKTLKFNWTGKEGEDGTAETIDISHLTQDGDKTLKFDGVKSFDFYDIDGNKPTFSLQSTHNLDKGDENYLATAKLPLPYDFSLYGKKGSEQDSSYGIGYQKDWELDNLFTKDKSLDNKGIFSINADANLATGDKGVMFNFRMPLSSNKLRKKPLNFDNYDIQPTQIKDHVRINDELVFMPEKEQFDYNQAKENSGQSWSADTAGKAYNIYKSKPWIPKDRMHMPIRQAEGGRIGLAGGGRTSTGLNYLLGEDDQNSRVPFKDGTKFDPKRRGFLKVAAGLATLPFIGKYFKWAKPLAKSSKVLTQVPIGNASGMPAWFKPLVNKVIKEGDDVTKKFATKDREIVHQVSIEGKIGKDALGVEDVRVTQSLDDGTIRLQYNSPDTIGESGVELVYKKGEEIPIKKKGKDTSVKEKDEFTAVEDDFYPQATSPDGDFDLEFTENVVNKVDDLYSDTSKLKEFATGKKRTIKEISESIKKKNYLKEVEKNPNDHAFRNVQDYDGPYDEFASGGRVPLAGGGPTLKFLKKIFGSSLDDMPRRDPELYKGLLEVTPMFRSRNKTAMIDYMEKYLPHKSRAEIEEFILGADDDVIGNLIRLGSGRDYKGKIEMIKKLEKTNKLRDFDVTGRKPNAIGGRVPRSGGGIMKLIKMLQKQKQKPFNVKEFIEKREFILSLIGQSSKQKNKRVLKEILEESEKIRKNPEFKFPDAGPGSDIHKEIEMILSRDVTKHASGGLAGMLGK